MNLQDTLNCVIGEDVVAEGLSGHEPHAREVLGYHVGGQIVMDAIEHDLHSLESTKLDVSQCRFPITHVYAEDDKWTNLEEVESVFGEDSDAGSRRDLHPARGDPQARVQPRRRKDRVLSGNGGCSAGTHRRRNGSRPSHFAFFQRRS